MVALRLTGLSLRPGTLRQCRLRHGRLASQSLGSGTDVLANEAVTNIFTGVNADLAVNDTDAWIYRLGYNITLIGRIVFIAPPVIE